MNRILQSNFKQIAYTLLITCFTLLGNEGSAKTIFQDTVANARRDSLKRLKPVAIGLKPNKVPVLFAEQSKDQLIQSVSYLDGKRLESSPVTLLANALAGQLAGLNVTQSNGVPRFDNPSLSLRGRSPLVVVDGIPRYNLVGNGQNLYSVLAINPEQVESITLLKDALSTVMLGNRGMNGVLMITTKKKGVGNGSTLDFTAQAGVQTPIGMRKPLSAFDYASLYNEAAVNSGYAPVFNQTQLAGYQSGENPYLYPNVNYKDEVLRKNALSQRYNVSASGNYTNVKYFLSIDYQAQQGLFKEPADSIEQTNVDFKRYLIRSNVELKLDKRLTANFNLMANIQDFFQPGVGYETVFNNVMFTPSNAAPIYNPNGTFGGTVNYSKNPYAQSVASGHIQDNLQAAAIDIGLKRVMDDFIPGTWLKAQLSYNPSYDHQIDRSRGYNAYDVVQSVFVNTISDRSNNASVIKRFQQTYLELSGGIDRSWKKNTFTGILLANLENSQEDNDLNQIYKNIATRLSYSYDRRFNIETGGSYSTNNRYAPGNKGNFFPAVGASWNIHNEAFFKRVKVINELKLRASYGSVGNSNPGYYLFRENYTTGPNYFFGSGATSINTLYQDGLANPNRVAEKSDKLNIGVDLAYAKQRGWLSFDYYNHHQYDLLQQRGSNSAVFGQSLPNENIGINRYYGFEVNTGWTDKIGKLHYTISGNLSTVGSKVIFNDELPTAYSYMEKTGYPINQIRGFVSDGLFNADNLNSATFSGFKPKPGDAKYKDLNNDGIINQFDETIIGNKNPLVYYGGNLNLTYGGFDLNVFFQGVLNRDIMLSGNYEFPFNQANGKGQAYEHNLARYTPQTAETATLPRLTLGNDNNNYIASSLFLRKANYLRLKNAEIGYSFSSHFLSSAKIKRIRIFVNGQNLATFSKYKESDPENYTGLYPLQRVVNGGISVKL